MQEPRDLDDGEQGDQTSAQRIQFPKAMVQYLLLQ